MALNIKPPDHHHFLPPPIPTIDMSSLTHSELHSLSLLSSSSPNDTASNYPTSAPKFFINPSQSTYQQTYSLSPHHPRRHRFSLLTQERYESNLIVTLLKKHLQFDDSTPDVGPPQNYVNAARVIEIVNRNGVVVDLAELEERENEGGPFAEELRRRAEGRVKQEELLEMLADMEGEWCSRRKRRRVVDASSLGDALPVGWKIIVALRRKGGQFFPYCRRYISPTGEHLWSCKEVSSYLKSYFGINNAKLVRDNKVESQQLQIVDSINHMCINSENSIMNSPIRSACVPIEHEKEASILGNENLSDVPVCDLYECHSCNINFDVKDKYLEHVLSLHQKTTKRYTLDSSVEDKVINKDGKSESQKRRRRRLGLSVSDGVIIKDGKYGCQFCDKVFEERRRYLGHVGNHVKGSIKTPKELLLQLNGLAGSSCLGNSPTSISNSRMDALIEIAQSSAQDTSAPMFEPSIDNNVNQHSVAENSQSMDANQKIKKNSSICHKVSNSSKRSREGKTFSGELYPCKMVSGLSSVCPDGSVRNKGFEEGKTSSAKLHSPCNIMNKMLLPDVNVNRLEPSPLEHEGSEEKSLSTGLISKMSTTDGETKWHSSTCNAVDSEKSSCSNETITTAKSGIAEIVGEMMTIPAAISGIAGNGKCKTTSADKGSADKPAGGFNVHYVKALDIDSSGKKIQSECVHHSEPNHAHDDSELVTNSSKNHVSDCTMPQISLNSLSTFDDIFEKEGQDICSLDQSVTDLEYLKLDVIEPHMYKYNAMNREDSISFYEVSMDLGNNIGLGLGLDKTLKSQSDFPQEMAHRCLTTTVCVWCGVEFSHEIAGIEPQPDSVGFMCPACRAKISKQFNELESNFSLSSHCFN